MSTIELKIYCDGCPTDWLSDNNPSQWHTIAFVLDFDSITLKAFAEVVCAQLPSAKLRQWKDSGASYRNVIPQAVANALTSNPLIINVVSFTEETARAIFAACCSDLKIRFEESNDAKGRKVLLHQFVTFDGYYRIEGIEKKVVPVVIWVWLFLHQYQFYETHVARDVPNSTLALTVIVDRLSGDNDQIKWGEHALFNTINPDREDLIKIQISPDDVPHEGDLLADNIAGALNAFMQESSLDVAERLETSSGLIDCWKILTTNSLNIPHFVPARSKFSNPAGEA